MDPRSQRARLLIYISVVTALLFAASCLFLWFFRYYKPRRDSESLLAGDVQVQISSVVIRGQRKELLLTDYASVQYLTAAFRSAEHHSSCLGTWYEAEIRLSSGGTVQCGLYVPDMGGSVPVCFPLDGIVPESMEKHLIKLPEPMPNALSVTLARLR
jgi:hypothetical protein